MWLLSLRDLQYRIRRFLIAVGVTALVFGIAVSIDGIKRTVNSEPTNLVATFGADTWIVPAGNSSPFTTTALLPQTVVDELAATPGVRRARAVISGRATVLSGKRQNVNLVGFDVGDGHGPSFDRGRAPKAEDEVAIGDGIDADVGDTLRTTTGTMRVVGVIDGLRFNGGSPTLLMSAAGAQRVVLAGQPYVFGVAVEGKPDSLPAGTTATSNEVSAADLSLTVKSATATIDFVALMTWVIAAGVIGAIIYLSSIERSRDFAVLRATGTPNRTIVGGLMLQSVLLATLAALLSVPLAFVLRFFMPFPVTLAVESVVRILFAGIIIGMLASLAAVRRALTTDPASAFGGA
jgi:putative ABC transport system permease protein